MNYLAKNTNNSLLLPNDVMKLIYNFADTLVGVRKYINGLKYELEYIFKSYGICGLNTLYKDSYRSKMIKDLQITNSKINYKKYHTKKLYKKWLKL